ncbi:MAG: Gfo/Idh/MocA family oxidoreductase [Proteobacteria bacterium]|nr:Gfo/Idh/MocA family oxidoreductase [Pseudomonadota bacterium]
MTKGPLRWAVLGVGGAGRRRVEAIHADPKSQLAAVWRGRFAADAGAPVAQSLEDAVGLADAVYVCSPLEAHADQVEQVLRAGRSVVTEYPLATTTERAEQLYALARSRGLMLHVAHIELLSATARTLSDRVRSHTIRRVELFFSAPGPLLSGDQLAIRNIARLHRLVGVAGMPIRIDAVDHAEGELLASMTLKTGSRATLAFRQGPGHSRHTIMELTTAEGRWRQADRGLTFDGEPVELVPTEPVFVTDHRYATELVTHAAPTYVSQRRVVQVLEIAERLAAGSTGAL